MIQHIITCPVLIEELKKVLRDMAVKPTVHPMDYSVHINADIMEAELRRCTQEIQGARAGIGILVGQQCKACRPISEIAAGCHGEMPREENCIQMILGVEKNTTLLKDRTAIMTPGWITMMHQSIKDGNWRVEDARMNMGWYDQILMLDTGTMPLTDEVLLEFFELTQTPIDILKVDLDYFKQVITNMLEGT